jgi:hypothetical protein
MGQFIYGQFIYGQFICEIVHLRILKLWILKLRTVCPWIFKLSTSAVLPIFSYHLSHSSISNSTMARLRMTITAEVGDQEEEEPATIAGQGDTEREKHTTVPNHVDSDYTTDDGTDSEEETDEPAAEEGDQDCDVDWIDSEKRGSILVHNGRRPSVSRLHSSHFAVLFRVHLLPSAHRKGKREAAGLPVHRIS